MTVMSAQPAPTLHATSCRRFSPRPLPLLSCRRNKHRRILCHDNVYQPQLGVGTANPSASPAAYSIKLLHYALTSYTYIQCCIVLSLVTTFKFALERPDGCRSRQNYAPHKHAARQVWISSFHAFLLYNSLLYASLLCFLNGCCTAA